jgi:hypothetical protein
MKAIVPVLFCAVTWYDADGAVVAAGQPVLPDRDFAETWATAQIASDNLPYTFEVTCEEDQQQ